MREHILIPYAGPLSESLRDIGYGLETAVADIVDNSISANATHVSLLFPIDPNTRAHFGILDDGHGMDLKTLLESMRPGSRPPVQRSPDDLGRYGLGLKTASFSQCRRLTVISRIAGETAAARWDLDKISERNEWALDELDTSDIKSLPYVDQLPENGTLVLWENMDRFENGGLTFDLTRLRQLERHLSLVFHRFLGNEVPKRKVQISMNGNPVKGYDPFWSNSYATQKVGEEPISLHGETVKLKAFVLPHHTMLTPSELSQLEEMGDLLETQGIYIYRNYRLLTWGGWHRLRAPKELTKLVRIRLDFPGALDDYWSIDIKKAKAELPDTVRNHLKALLGNIDAVGKTVYRGRAQRVINHPEQIWERIQERDAVRYGIKHNHPLVSGLISSMSNHQKQGFLALVDMIADSLPIPTIYNDFAERPSVFESKTDHKPEHLIQRLRQFHSILKDATDIVTPEQLQGVAGILPEFKEIPEVLSRLCKEVCDE